MIKKLLKIICSIAIVFLIEVLCFNFSVILAKLKGIETLTLQSDDLEYLNWDTIEDGTKISLSDPMIYKENLSLDISNMVLILDVQPQPAFYTIFYTTEEGEDFSAEKMIVVESGQGEVEIPISGAVKKLRIDPGEEAGLVMRDITLKINDISWNISFARIIAMLLVFWGTAWLMRLQSPPDYGIKIEDEKNEA